MLDIITNSKKYVNMLLWPLDTHYYHEYEHALEVYDRCMYLWEKEWLWENDLEMLGLAALFHDVWFIIQYDDNEYIWAMIAKNYLKSMLYPTEKIGIIERIIISTKPDLKSTNILEKIIRDADTDNLWRDDFFEKWKRLKKEIETIKKIKIKDPDWNHHSLDFLSKHKFLTDTNIKERQQKKEENIQKLKKLKLKN